MVKLEQGLSFPAGLGFLLQAQDKDEAKADTTKEDKKKWKHNR